MERDLQEIVEDFLASKKDYDYLLKRCGNDLEWYHAALKIVEYKEDRRTTPLFSTLKLED